MKNIPLFKLPIDPADAEIARLEVCIEQLEAERNNDAWHKGWKAAVAERDEARQEIAVLRRNQAHLREIAQMLIDMDWCTGYELTEWLEKQ